MQVYNARMLHFQANLFEVFAEDTIVQHYFTIEQHYCEDFGLGWAVLQKTDFNH